MEQLSGYVSILPLYLQMLVLLGVSLLLSTLVTLIVFAVIRGAARRTGSHTLSLVGKQLQSPAFWTLAILLTLALWGELRADDPTEDPFYLAPAIHILRTIMYISVALLLMRVVNVISGTIRHRFDADNSNNLEERKVLTQLQYLERIAGIVIFILTVAFILLQFESVRNLGAGILTGAGVSGIIIGFAAQKSIANLLAGFQIAFTQPIRIDDALIVNGEFGRVEEITLTYVTLKLWDQRRLIVPLNKFIDESFQNWTRSSAQLIGSVFMYLDYTFPVADLRAEVARFLPSQELWDQQVQAVAVTDNNQEVMIVRILASAADSGQTFNLRCAIREHLIGWIQENYPEHLPKTRVELNRPG